MKFTTMIEGAVETGNFVGLPTALLYVPETLPITLPQGIYAARASMGQEMYPGIVAYGPDEFDGKDISLAFFPLDTAGFRGTGGAEVIVDIVKPIRGIMSFEIPEQFVQQFESDIRHARTILKV